MGQAKTKWTIVARLVGEGLPPFVPLPAALLDQKTSAGFCIIRAQSFWLDVLDRCNAAPADGRTIRVDAVSLLKNEELVKPEANEDFAIRPFFVEPNAPPFCIDFRLRPERVA